MYTSIHILLYICHCSNVLIPWIYVFLKVTANIEKAQAQQNITYGVKLKRGIKPVTVAVGDVVLKKNQTKKRSLKSTGKGHTKSLLSMEQK